MPSTLSQRCSRQIIKPISSITNSKLETPSRNLASLPILRLQRTKDLLWVAKVKDHQLQWSTTRMSSPTPTLQVNWTTLPRMSIWAWLARVDEIWVSPITPPRSIKQTRKTPIQIDNEEKFSKVRYTITKVGLRQPVTILTIVSIQIKGLSSPRSKDQISAEGKCSTSPENRQTKIRKPKCWVARYSWLRDKMRSCKRRETPWLITLSSISIRIELALCRLSRICSRDLSNKGSVGIQHRTKCK